MINQSLLNRNLHTTGKGEYVIGRLILGVLHGTQLVFAQCGPTHVFHMTGAETRQFHDEQLAGHGLGIGQAASLYLSQADLHAGDLLVLCPNLPTGWDFLLLGERNFSFETVRRSLFGTPGEDLNAILVQAQPGKGKLSILKGMPPSVEKPAPAASAVVLNPGSSLGQATPAGISSQIAEPVPAPNAPLSPPAVPASPSSWVESELPASRFTRLISGGAKPGPSSRTSAEFTPESGRNFVAPVGQQEAGERPVPPASRCPSLSNWQRVRPGVRGVLLPRPRHRSPQRSNALLPAIVEKYSEGWQDSSMGCGQVHKEYPKPSGSSCQISHQIQMMNLMLPAQAWHYSPLLFLWLLWQLQRQFTFTTGARLNISRITIWHWRRQPKHAA